MLQIKANDSFDVVVIGGGSAGINAAIQAGRAGVKTLLVEKNGMLGGTTTVGGVNFPGLFHSNGKQIIYGIPWEIITETLDICGEKLPDFKGLVNERHWKSQILVNPAIYASVCDQKILDANVTPLYHTLLAEIKNVSADQKNITLCTKGGLLPIVSKVIIDCTADANASSIAGFQVISENVSQPATLVATASGYDKNLIDLPSLVEAGEKAVAQGLLKPTDLSWNTQKISPKWVTSYGGNSNHIKLDKNEAHESLGKTLLDIEGRQSILRTFRFLKTQPGFEKLTIDSISPECGVRETVRIVGQKTVSHADYVTGKIHPDAVCNSFYPIDLHSSEKDGLEVTYLEKGVIPTIPRGAMLPKESSNFIVAGRCISCDRLANSALRVQASCMAMGQAAGAMAALSVLENQKVHELNISKIHELLKAHKAVLPGEYI